VVGLRDLEGGAGLEGVGAGGEVDGDRGEAGAGAVAGVCRAASATEVSPFRIVRTNADRRLAVHRCTPSGISGFIHPPPLIEDVFYERRWMGAG
jgi:hypothetical protein